MTNMSKRNWKNKVVRTKWKITKIKENPAVTKVEHAGKAISVKAGNYGPKEGTFSILMRSGIKC